MRVFAGLLLLLALSTPAFAVQPDEMLKNPALEARARALSRQLRCMVCQNQSIDDSEAPLAHDLRMLVRERLVKGDSDRQVIDFLVSRYGEFVLLKPPLEWRTLLLWAVPPGVLVIGLASLVILMRRKAKPAVDALTADEEARLAVLIDGEDRADRR